MKETYTYWRSHRSVRVHGMCVCVCVCVCVCGRMCMYAYMSACLLVIVQGFDIPYILDTSAGENLCELVPFHMKTFAGYMTIVYRICDSFHH